MCLPHMHETALQPERALLLHVHMAWTSEQDRQQRAGELASLAGTAGAIVVGHVSQVLSETHAASLIGAGKVQELAEAVAQAQADLVIVSANLTGSQLRTLEAACGVRTIDRTQLILDIFASRARSFEGKAQVALAQLQYTLPRLTGARANLSRQGGGIGTRGPGETALEQDRRRIRKRIAALEQVVREQATRRSELRARRRRQGVYSVAIVGYTNAGKTTLLSRLTGRYGQSTAAAGSDRLFDTLDVTSKRVVWRGRTYVFADTVGFIRDLPHNLVDAFRATLEEVVAADVIVHVIAADSPCAEIELATANAELDELQAYAPTIAVWNARRAHTAAGEDECAMRESSQPVPDRRARATIHGSVLEEATLQAVLDQVDACVGERRWVTLRIPPERPDVIADLYARADVDSVSADGESIVLRVRADDNVAGAWAGFVCDPLEPGRMQIGNSEHSR